MQTVVLPLLGNIHTNASITGSQSMAFVSESRQIIAEACGTHITSKASKHMILFTRSSTTSCVTLVIDILNLLFLNLKEIVVFLSCMKHYSNMILWREIGYRIVMIDITKDYLAVLEDELGKSEEKVKIGAFTTMLNVTGQSLDTEAISDVLHKYNAISVFYYATASSYLPTQISSKDIIYFSPYKLQGGYNTPGVLILKKSLIDLHSVPSKSKEGIVFYISKDHHRFLSNQIEWYEDSTPDIVGIVSVALALILKRNVEKQYEILAPKVGFPRTLLEYEYDIYDKVWKRLSSYPNLHILRPKEKKAPIFSFLI